MGDDCEIENCECCKARVHAWGCYNKQLELTDKLKEKLAIAKSALEFIEEENSYIDDNGNHVARQALAKINEGE